jgi:hypothetical protein
LYCVGPDARVRQPVKWILAAASVTLTTRACLHFTPVFCALIYRSVHSNWIHCAPLSWQCFSNWGPHHKEQCTQQMFLFNCTANHLIIFFPEFFCCSTFHISYFIIVNLLQ